jgi:putative membrane protein
VSIRDLPLLNATLNGTAAVLLVWAYLLIRRRRVAAHRAVMITAFCVSVAFLISYITYHAHIGSKHYEGAGWLRPLYYSILLTHTLLAVMVPVLAIITLRRGLRMDVVRHRAIARWTLPIWLYVSVTGVVVYVMLYHG